MRLKGLPSGPRPSAWVVREMDSAALFGITLVGDLWRSAGVSFSGDAPTYDEWLAAIKEMRNAPLIASRVSP